MNKPFVIATDVALTVTARGRIKIYCSDQDGYWFSDQLCVDGRYALDFCALHLNDVEAFIVACAIFTGNSIESFDDKAVAKFIEMMRRDWRFVT